MEKFHVIQYSPVFAFFRVLYFFIRKENYLFLSITISNAWQFTSSLSLFCLFVTLSVSPLFFVFFFVYLTFSLHHITPSSPLSRSNKLHWILSFIFWELVCSCQLYETCSDVNECPFLNMSPYSNVLQWQLATARNAFLYFSFFYFFILN